MPSSSNHNTEKELRLIGSYITAHVRLWHADAVTLTIHLTAAFAAVLEMEEEELEEEMRDETGDAMVADEEAKIHRWQPNNTRLIISAAEVVNDAARDTAGEFGEKEQEILYDLAEKMVGIAQRMR